MLKTQDQPHAHIQKTYGKTLQGFNLIQGEDVPSVSKETFASHNPSDLSDCVGVFPKSSKADVLKAAQAAQTAFQTWKITPAPIRAQMIGKLGEIIEKNKSELSFLITREIGKTLKEASGSVQEVIDTCHFFQSEGRRLYGQTVPSEMRNKELFTYRRPLGVVGVITASNFPIAVPSWKIIPALLCGNTVVWKSPPESPAVSYVFGKCIEAAGIPKGVFNLIHGDASTGEALLSLVEEGLIQKISFTGSSRVGKIVGEVCGRNLQVPSLELGGKNPLVVMDDADLDLAVSGALWASFGTAGQRCTSAGNLILHEKIASTFKEKFLKAVQTIKIGNPILNPDVLYGPMIAQKYVDAFLSHLENAQKSNAKKIYGEGRITQANKPQNFVGDAQAGLYMWPHVFENVSIDSYLGQEEVFGPLIGLITVKNLDEAIQTANGTKYGLSAAIYTQNRMSAYRFKNEVQSGMCSINNSTTGAEAHLPFGGVKNSGNGTRESGIWVIDAYTQWQAVNDELSGKLQLAQMDTESVVSLSSVDFKGLLPC